MGGTGRLRTAVYDYLENEGSANTTEIFEHINDRFRWGATMNQLGNILARDSRFMKSGFDNGHYIDGMRYRVCVWTLS